MRASLKRLQLSNRFEFLTYYFESDSMTNCNYYKTNGKCSFGCWEEPRCMTNGPWMHDERRMRGVEEYVRKWSKWYDNQLIFYSKNDHHRWELP